MVLLLSICVNATNITTATRTFTTPITSGATIIIAIDISSAHPITLGVTEYYPVGWVVSDITGGGINRSDPDRIEWGMYYPNGTLDTILTYKVTSPNNASGYYYFNGSIYSPGGSNSTTSGCAAIYVIQSTSTTTLTSTTTSSTTSSSTTTSSTTTTTVSGYCSSASQSMSYEHVKRVVLNTGDRSSSASYYSDYTGTVFTTLTNGQTYTLKVEGYAPNAFTEYVKAWIDFNQDQDFNDTGEEIDLGSHTYTGAGAYNFLNILTVPPAALQGNTRLRVSMKWSTAPSPCDSSISYGEVEDYTVTISSGGTTTTSITTTSTTTTSTSTTSTTTTMLSTTSTTYVTTTTVPSFTVTAIRNLPLNVNPGQNFTVTIPITMGSGVIGAGVVEIFPAGWPVSAISTGGHAKTSPDRVEWIIFTGSNLTDSTLSYQLTVPVNASGTANFSGNLSFSTGSESVITQIGGANSVNILQGCSLKGDYTPCDTVEVVEIIDAIASWATGGNITISDVLNLISAWATDTGQ